MKSAKRTTRGRKPARRRTSQRPRARRGAPEGWGGLGRLDQRHLDLIGLGLVAVATYLFCVLYLGWNGGRVGAAAEDGLTYVAGACAAIVPIVIAAVGVALVLRPFMGSPAAVNAGVVCIVAAVLLAYAAQTGGLGPDAPPNRHGYFDPDFFSEHGGILGETLYWATTTLFQRIGAHIISVLLLVAGLLLVSGTTVAGLIRALGRFLGVARNGALELGTAVRETAARRRRPQEEKVLTRVSPTEPIATELLGPEPEDGESGADTGEVPVSEPATNGDGSPQALSFDEAVATPQPDDDDPAAPPEPGEEIEVARTPQGERRTRGGITESDEIDYKLPSPEVLERGGNDPGPDTRNREAVGRGLLETLGSFGVEAEIVGTVIGPHVSRYELRLAPGTKVAKVTQLKDDLAYALASTDIRILAPIPGKQAIGVEVPNQRRRLVRLGDIYQGRPQNSSPIVGWLGKDIAGHAVWTDLAKMPHVLVAGTTGSGKSGCINAILSSLLLHASPNELRLVLVDPKRVELNHYEHVPHLLTPVVTAPRLAANVLANLIGEMESRYEVMGELRARNLVELNRARKRAGEPPLPHVLCVIDELADLMMVAPAEVEDSIIRLAQKSRAVGIHLVLATQRPSTDVITGTIKVNIPARIAFAVASQVDSRVILDQGGAETLLGQGDMLFRPAGTSKLQRIQGAFVTEEEIARLTKHWAAQGEPEFAEELLEAQLDEAAEEAEREHSPDQDDLLGEAVRLVVSTQTASVSMIQRRLRVGYTRAGRLIDMLERRGVISGYEGSKPRQVLVSEAELPRMLERIESGGAAADGGEGLAAEPVTAGEAPDAPPEG
ncbi:MAG TPA: DNA translocase FtsK [Solirubrobacterales bacterium]|nr:DNA translocase FtsK [Solirubrobacterales bacterium]